MMVLASTSSRRRSGRAPRRARPARSSSCSSSTPWADAATGSRSVAEEHVGVLVGRSPASCRTRPAARARRPAGRPPRPARAGRSSSGGSPSTSRLPAGISSRSPSSGGAVLAHEHHHGVPSSSNSTGTTPTAPGWRTTSRSNRAVGPVEGADHDARMTWPCVDRALGQRRERRPGRPAAPLTGLSRPTARLAIELNGRCGLRPSARPSAAPTNSRNSGCGPVGPALELGVGLGADPERVAVELDELDQPAVGRRARAARSPAPRSWRGTAG